MQRFGQFGTLVISPLALLGTSATADITAQDVWASQTAYYAATGAKVTGTLQVTDNLTVIDDAVAVYALPFGVGTVRVEMPPLHMRDNADGSVTFEDPGEMTIKVSADIDNTSVSATIGVTHVNFSGTATGDPGDITYVYEAGRFTIDLREIQLPEDGLDFSMIGEGEGYTVTSRVVEGALITTETTSTVLPLTVNYDFATSDGITASSSASYGVAETTGTIALLASGANILDLSPAFRDGMMISIASTTAGNASQIVTMLEDQLVSEQTTESGASQATMTLDASGLDLSFDAADFLVSINQPDMLPFPLEFEATAASGGYQLPILASDAAQPFGFDLGMKGLRLSPSIWALFDENKELPRDPMSLGIEIDGSVISGVDLLNVLELEAVMDQATPPISLESLSIKDLSLAAIGGSLQARADMVFDNTDLETFDGFPRPTGDAFMTVSGANAVLDRLVSAGAITESDASGARLGMGLFARATGDDSFETSADINDEGHVTVNGQRIR